MKAFIALSSKILLKMTPMYTGKVLANSKEIQDIQSIPVGEIRYTSKFLCCSNMINLHLFFLPSFVISHECRSTLLANIMISMNSELFLALLPQANDWIKML